MEILVIFLLTLVNGFFSLSEIALVSVKESRIQALADRGSKRARTILAFGVRPAAPDSPLLYVYVFDFSRYTRNRQRTSPRHYGR